jgi:hypothetical protein
LEAGRKYHVSAVAQIQASPIRFPQSKINRPRNEAQVSCDSEVEVMQCLKCQAEVSEWHFYCQNCRAQIQSFRPEAEKPSRGVFERAGARTLNALLLILGIAVLVLAGRAVQWSELFASIRGAADVSAESGARSEARRRPLRRSDADRREDESPKLQKTIEGAGRGKSAAVESVREMRQKIEELPSVEDQPQSPKPSEAPVRNERAPESTSKPAVHAPPSTAADAQLGIEQIDVKNSGETGFVAINSYMPARIYINGQFSGTTPRTIKLNAGDHQIRLIADGYEDWTRRVRLKTKQQVGIMASMKKKVPQKD